MILNKDATIKNGELIISDEFSVKLATQQKFTNVKDMAKLNFAFQKGALTESAFDNQYDLVIFVGECDAPISHFNTSLKVREFKYSENRKEVMIIGYIDHHSTLRAEVNLFKLVGEKYYQTSYRYNYSTKNQDFLCSCLGVKPVKFMKKPIKDKFVFIDDYFRTIKNNALLPATVLIPPGYTHDRMIKDIRYEFKNVVTVKPNQLQNYMKEITSHVYMLGFNENQIKAARIMGIMHLNAKKRKAEGFSIDNHNHVTGEVVYHSNMETTEEDDIVRKQLPVSEEPDGEGPEE